MSSSRLSRLSRADWLIVVSLISTVAILTIGLGSLAVDDAFVTYHYAVNLAHQEGFVYNRGQAVLSTTAPLYGLLLAPFAWLGFDVPIVSNLISAISIGAGSLLLFAIARRRGRLLVGWLAGMLFVLSPLLWLGLGMETALHLALILAAFAADDFDCPGIAGIMLGAAFVTRYDAAVPAVIILLRRLIDRRPFGSAQGRPPTADCRIIAHPVVRMAAVGFVVAAPVLLYLTLTFGSPLPATLAAKRAQIVLGVTGFYAGTTYLEGLLILVNGWLSQTWLYVIPVIALLVGLALAILRDRWVLPFLLWACVQIVAYTALGVAPYFWYYAPLVPAMAWLIATSAECGIVIASKAKQSPIRHVGIASTQKTRLAMTLVVCLIVLVPFVISIAAIWQAQSGPLPSPDTDASKVLPEAKVTIYRRVGEWIEANTPRDATLGATEVGIIGFYARRTTIDFLGLLQPDVARALTQGDPSWTLFAYQPDYLALTAVNPIYNLDPRHDDWFQAAYRPIQRFDDARFWGSPVVVYRREVPRVSLPEGDSISLNAMQVNVLFDKSIRLLAVETSAETVYPGDALAVHLWWRAEAPIVQDYRLSVQLLGQNDLIVAQHDGQPGLGARPISTWSPGKVISDLVLIGLPKTTCAPDIAQLNIVLYDPATGERLPVMGADGRALGDSLRLDRFDVKSVSGDNSGTNRVDVSFARALTLTSYRISSRVLSPGETLTLSLGWQTGQEWREGLSVFVHLVADDGKIIAQADGPPTLTGDWRSLRVPPSASLGVYRLLVGVYRPETGERLPWADAVGQPLGNSVPLCPVRVR